MSLRTLGSTPANVALPINSYVGTVDPTSNDDNSLGFDTGSMWITSTTNRVWVCTKATIGAAIWHALGLIFPVCNYAATRAPIATDDASHGYAAGSLWIDQTHQQVHICMSATTGAANWRQLKT